MVETAVLPPDPSVKVSPTANVPVTIERVAETGGVFLETRGLILIIDNEKASEK